MNWEQRNLKPPTAYLYVPNISAIPTHIRDLLAGHNIDLWLVQVYKRFDGTVFFATMGVLLLILAIGLALLFTSLKEPTLDRHRRSQIRATFEPTFPPTRRR
jgi:Na+/melibiose symporter-like transporter